MLGTVLLRLPVHPGGALVVHLHPVHAYVALSRFRVSREHQRKRNEASTVLRPALQNRKVEKVDVASLLNDFLAGAVVDAFRKEGAKFRKLRQHLELVKEPLWRFHFQKSANSLGHVIQFLDFKGQLHPANASKGVNQQRYARSLGLFEK